MNIESIQVQDPSHSKSGGMTCRLISGINEEMYRIAKLHEMKITYLYMKKEVTGREKQQRLGEFQYSHWQSSLYPDLCWP